MKNFLFLGRPFCFVNHFLKSSLLYNSKGSIQRIFQESVRTILLLEIWSFKVLKKSPIHGFDNSKRFCSRIVYSGFGSKILQRVSSEPMSEICYFGCIEARRAAQVTTFQIWQAAQSSLMITLLSAPTR